MLSTTISFGMENTKCNYKGVLSLEEKGICNLRKIYKCKDYEKAKIIFDAMKTNNCPCTIHHKKISKFIILKQYNEFPNNIH